MMYSEENSLLISGIQHFVFCRRQWAIIHIEKQWAENLLTVSGEIMHENAHNEQFSEKRKNVIISRGMPVSSVELGIYGECDIVEFYKAEEGAVINGREALYKIIPVEYKHGEPKESDADVLQVAAQAICLEDMFCTKIDEIHIFYGKTKHRLKIPFDDEIRNRVMTVINEMHMLYERKYTPKVKPHKGCRNCSLCDLCLPRLNKISSVSQYIAKNLEEE